MVHVVVLGGGARLIRHERLGARKRVVGVPDGVAVADREAFGGKGGGSGGSGDRGGPASGSRAPRPPPASERSGRHLGKRARAGAPRAGARSSCRRAPLRSGGNSAVNSRKFFSSSPRSSRSPLLSSTLRIACVAHALLMTWRGVGGSGVGGSGVGVRGAVFRGGAAPRRAAPRLAAPQGPCRTRFRSRPASSAPPPLWPLPPPRAARPPNLVGKKDARRRRRAVDRAVVLLRAPFEEEDQAIHGPGRGGRWAREKVGKVCASWADLATPRLLCFRARRPRRPPLPRTATLPLQLPPAARRPRSPLPDLSSARRPSSSAYSSSTCAVGDGRRGTDGRRGVCARRTHACTRAAAPHGRARDAPARPRPASRRACTPLTPICWMSSVNTPGSLSIVVHVSPLAAMAAAAARWRCGRCGGWRGGRVRARGRGGAPLRPIRSKEAGMGRRSSC
jgi:hypothetical protein